MKHVTVLIRQNDGPQHDGGMVQFAGVCDCSPLIFIHKTNNRKLKCIHSFTNSVICQIGIIWLYVLGKRSYLSKSINNKNPMEKLDVEYFSLCNQNIWCECGVFSCCHIVCHTLHKSIDVFNVVVAQFFLQIIDDLHCFCWFTTLCTVWCVRLCSNKGKLRNTQILCKYTANLESVHDYWETYSCIKQRYNKRQLTYVMCI